MKKSYCAGAVAAVLAVAGLSVRAQDMPPGAVYTSSNEAAGNRLFWLKRDTQGNLSMAGSIATGGLGTGTSLGNAGALAPALGPMLYVVNAGSDSITMVLRTPNGPRALLMAPSGGVRPVSLASSWPLLYVVNAGGSEGDADNISGFFTGILGIPVPLSGSTQQLSSANTAPAQIGFTPFADGLVVTEKATNKITTFDLIWGRPGQAQPQNSAGTEPFGFAFNRFGRLIVAEAFNGAADASAVSSYRINFAEELTVLDESEPTTETSACWIAHTSSGRYTYVSNTGSGTITGFKVDALSGNLTRLDADGVTASIGTGTNPTDVSVLGNRFLYVLAAAAGRIDAYRINPDGSLTALTGVSGLPAGCTGLVSQ